MPLPVSDPKINSIPACGDKPSLSKEIVMVPI